MPWKAPCKSYRQNASVGILSRNDLLAQSKLPVTTGYVSKYKTQMKPRNLIYHFIAIQVWCHTHCSSVYPLPTILSFSVSKPARMAESDTDLFQYTAGRWLRNEEKKLQNRYTPFNVSELKRIAAHSISADTCTVIMELAEGNYNKCFRLEMDNELTVIARIPHPNAGPRYYTTASGVATMDFVSF